VYFSKKRLADSNMAIYKAILKYGYENFKLEILEYCDKNILLVREQYYIDHLKPEYNILNKAGSNIGYKHKA
jgi:group I intron endonuclease